MLWSTTIINVVQSLDAHLFNNRKMSVRRWMLVSLDRLASDQKPLCVAIETAQRPQIPGASQALISTHPSSVGILFFFFLGFQITSRRVPASPHNGLTSLRLYISSLSDVDKRSTPFVTSLPPCTFRQPRGGSSARVHVSSGIH